MYSIIWGSWKPNTLPVRDIICSNVWYVTVIQPRKVLNFYQKKRTKYTSGLLSAKTHFVMQDLSLCSVSCGRLCHVYVAVHMSSSHIQMLCWMSSMCVSLLDRPFWYQSDGSSDTMIRQDDTWTKARLFTKNCVRSGFGKLHGKIIFCFCSLFLIVLFFKSITIFMLHSKRPHANSDLMMLHCNTLWLTLWRSRP